MSDAVTLADLVEVLALEVQALEDAGSPCVGVAKRAHAWARSVQLRQQWAAEDGRPDDPQGGLW